MWYIDDTSVGVAENRPRGRLKRPRRGGRAKIHGLALPRSPSCLSERFASAPRFRHVTDPINSPSNLAFCTALKRAGEEPMRFTIPSCYSRGVFASKLIELFYLILFQRGLYLRRRKISISCFLLVRIFLVLRIFSSNFLWKLYRYG